LNNSVFCNNFQGIYDAKLGRNLNYNETLVVPIVENTPFEADLETSLADAIEKYPGTSAVLVRRHGFYVWGNSWQQAKVMAECYDYLFDMAVQMKQMGLDASVTPCERNNGAEFSF
jgi:methylthioribulose-1-phosphate dehydratase